MGHVAGTTYLQVDTPTDEAKTYVSMVSFVDVVLARNVYGAMFKYHRPALFYRRSPFRLASRISPFASTRRSLMWNASVTAS